MKELGPADISHLIESTDCWIFDCDGMHNWRIGGGRSAGMLLLIPLEMRAVVTLYCFYYFYRSSKNVTTTVLHTVLLERRVQYPGLNLGIFKTAYLEQLPPTAVSTLN